MINKDTYKRLTKKDKYGHWYTETKINDRFMWSKDGKVWERDLSHYAFDGEAIDRLAELEDKIENGTLVELPCKVDDTVYFIEERVDLKTWKRYFEIQEYTCWDITIDENGTCIHDGIRYYFGERAFTTKAQAEARLKELQGE